MSRGNDGLEWDWVGGGGRRPRKRFKVLNPFRFCLFTETWNKRGRDNYLTHWNYILSLGEHHQNIIKPKALKSLYPSPDLYRQWRWYFPDVKPSPVIFNFLLAYLKFSLWRPSNDYCCLVSAGSIVSDVKPFLDIFL